MHPTPLQRQPRPTHELVVEHRVLMRQIAGLQRHSGELLQASAQRERALLAENLCLRAQLVLLRTSVFWGLGAAVALRRPVPPRLPARSNYATEAPAAQAVICQTGCVGHAHPWLEADGQCRRSGQVCVRVDMGEIR
jgi:hypothetical protein